MYQSTNLPTQYHPNVPMYQSTTVPNVSISTMVALKLAEQPKFETRIHPIQSNGESVAGVADVWWLTHRQRDEGRDDDHEGLVEARLVA